MLLNYNSAHAFVHATPTARWDGWDIIFFSPTPAGFSHTKGSFHEGQWGIESRVRPNGRGLWSVQQRK